MRWKWRKTGHGATDNLGKQFEKVVKCCNQGSTDSRYTYIEAEKQFLGYIARTFGLEKLANIQDKHLEGFVKYSKEKGDADKYIKNKLSAIRFFHNQTNGTKYELTDSDAFNKLVGLGSTPDGRVDRAWEESEIRAIQAIDIERNRPELVNVIEGIRSTGCRIDEICTIRHHQLINALKTDYLSLVNTKGGRPRDVPLNPRSRKILQRMKEDIGKAEYVFTSKHYVETNTIHKFEKSIQNFIGYHRNKIQNPDRSNTAHNLNPNEKAALTAHGLRHSFAREKYFEKREEGLKKEQARLCVAEMLGHGRDDITYIYLAGLED